MKKIIDNYKPYPSTPQVITDTLEKNYMPYAMSVIVSRAIPEIDGFKPSHRKLLYTMYKMGLLNGNRTKSANIVGQTMKLNPHGDAAIYETMVRLSEGYDALLTPFIDSKGNFGKVYSRDMAYAASRYTEAKLSEICREIFADIDSDAVDFVDNYDGEMKEPSLLPTSYPNVLVNANTGIAVGMASSICGFNLTEVCKTAIELIKNPQHNIMETLKAPDFSTGAELILDRASMSEIYETGRGSFKMRAKWKYISQGNMIEITEIPYSTSVEAVIDKIIELVKAGKIKEIADIRDETDLKGLKLTLDLKRGTDAHKLMAKLMRMTPLMDSFSCNFNILIDGAPKVLGVREIYSEWTNWRVKCIKRKLKSLIAKKSERLHLLKGLRLILLDIDKAIKIIKDTEEDAQVVPNLMIGFGVDEAQAEFIAEIKLRNINRENILKKINETDELEKEIADLTDTLNDIRRINKLIIADLENVIKKYGAPRKTQIVEGVDLDDFLEEPETPDYVVNLFLTKEGYFKKITPQSLRMSGEQKLKDGDEIKQSFETNNRAELLILSNMQFAYKVKVSDFDDSKASVLGDYLPTKIGMEQGEIPLFMCVAGDYRGSLLLVFENGKIARVALDSFDTKSNRKRLSKAFSDKSPLVCAFKLKDETDIMLYASNGKGMLVNTALIDIKPTRTTQGIFVMNLRQGHKIVSAKTVKPNETAELLKYRPRNIPSAGTLLRDEDSLNSQITFE